MSSVSKNILDEIATRIAGEIVLSENPGKTMRKWRELFKISQVELASHMGLFPSVISDYESGRRKSPGANMIKKFVKSLIAIDMKRGMSTLSTLVKLSLGSDKLLEAVLDMREFQSPISVGDFCDKIDAVLIVGEEYRDTLIFGYTVVDSIKLVLEVPSYEYIRLYGATTQRAAIFTKVTYGRSPLVAVKAMQAGMGGLKPAIIILHGPEKVDPLGISIAKLERIPLALSKAPTIQALLDKLKKIK